MFCFIYARSQTKWSLLEPGPARTETEKGQIKPSDRTIKRWSGYVTAKINMAYCNILGKSHADCD